LTASKPIIAVDIDDVLASSAAAFVAFSNERWGTNLTVDDYTDDWATFWKLDRADKGYAALVDGRAAEFFAHALRPMPHDVSAYDVLVRLKEHFDLIVVTARRLDTKGDTVAWIQERFAGIFEHDKIYFAGFYDNLTNDSVKVNVKKDKGELLKSLGAQYLIDDQPKHCNGAVRQGITALLFGGYAWQHTEPVDDSVIRVANWQEVGEFFDAAQKRIS
jgi:5'(3')-deoxyribonucleotidase